MHAAGAGAAAAAVAGLAVKSVSYRASSLQSARQAQLYHVLLFTSVLVLAAAVHANLQLVRFHGVSKSSIS